VEGCTGKDFWSSAQGGSVSAEISPELLGRRLYHWPGASPLSWSPAACLNALVLIPLIKFFGEGFTGVIAPGTIPIGEMSVSQIRGSYILYIGAGAVAAGGIISLVRFAAHHPSRHPRGLADFRKAAAAHSAVIRTERDLSMKLVAVGIVVLIGAILAARPLHMNLLGAILIVLFGFLFVHGFVAVDRRNRFFLQSHFRHDRRHLAVDLPDLSGCRWTAERTTSPRSRSVGSFASPLPTAAQLRRI